MTEESITITKSELQDLISDGIAKAIKPSRSMAPQFIFQCVQLAAAPIRNINEKYPMSARCNEGVYCGRTYSRHQSRNYSSYGSDLNHSTPCEVEVRDLIRKLTLAVYGEGLNRNLSFSDWNNACTDYATFSDMFLKMYERRLDRLFGDSDEQD